MLKYKDDQICHFLRASSELWEILRTYLHSLAIHKSDLLQQAIPIIRTHFKLSLSFVVKIAIHKLLHDHHSFSLCQQKPDHVQYFHLCLLEKSVLFLQCIPPTMKTFPACFWKHSWQAPSTPSNFAWSWYFTIPIENFLITSDFPFRHKMTKSDVTVRLKMW